MNKNAISKFVIQKFLKSIIDQHLGVEFIHHTETQGMPANSVYYSAMTDHANWNDAGTLVCAAELSFGAPTYEEGPTFTGPSGLGLTEWRDRPEEARRVNMDLAKTLEGTRGPYTNSEALTVVAARWDPPPAHVRHLIDRGQTGLTLDGHLQLATLPGYIRVYNGSLEHGFVSVGVTAGTIQLNGFALRRNVWRVNPHSPEDKEANYLQYVKRLAWVRTDRRQRGTFDFYSNLAIPPAGVPPHVRKIVADIAMRDMRAQTWCGKGPRVEISSNDIQGINCLHVDPTTNEVLIKVEEGPARKTPWWSYLIKYNPGPLRVMSVREAMGSIDVGVLPDAVPNPGRKKEADELIREARLTVTHKDRGGSRD